VAAKAAAVAFTRMLAVELTGTGVTATVVCPGLVDTEWSGGINHRDPRAMPPDDVAQALWTAFQQNEVLCIPGIDEPDLIQRWTDQEPTLLHTGNRARLAPRYARTPAIGEPPGFHRASLTTTCYGARRPNGPG
jgi:short-subunit dehydrogenase